MRYSKIALLIFGAGLVLGLVVVVAELSAFGRVASVTMAFGIVMLPAALIMDWRRARAPPPKRRRRGKAKPGAGKRRLAQRARRSGHTRSS
jgi:hypothetical protein